MATVTTTTIADGLSSPGVAPVLYRKNSTGSDYMYTVMRTATDTLSFYVSINAGTSWALQSSWTHTGLQEWSSLVYDNQGYLHIAYRVSTGTADVIYYRRYYTATGTWSAAVQVSGTDANGGVTGNRWQGVDLVVFRNSDGSYSILVAGAYADTTPRYGAIAMGVSISASGTIQTNNLLMSGTRGWFVSGTLPGRSGVVCEPEHNGDGFTTSTPNVWITWGRNTLQTVKMAWVSSAKGWQGPTSQVTVRSSLPTNNDYVSARWDGSRQLMAVPSPDDTTVVRVYQRDKSNTTQATYDSPSHPNGVVKYVALSYDYVTKNVRVYAVGTSAATLYYVDYSRSAGTWSAWAQVSASTIASSGAEFGVKRGGTWGDSRHDVVYSVSGSPNTITHTQQVASAAPKTAVFVTTGQAYTNGSAANVGATLPLSWTFSDIDPGSSQGSYALSRQIGSGTVSYWNATTTAWVASEVQNTSSTTGVTLPTAWGVDGDSQHQYKVKVWDNLGVVSPGYSDPLGLYPSAPVNPAVTAPTAGATVNSDTLTVTWTAAEQTGARVVLAQTSPAGGTVYDSGPMIGYAATSFTIPYALLNGYGYTVTLYTYNNDQLQSVGQSRAVTVSYAPPAAMYSTFTPVTLSGYITVAGTSSTPVSPQPSIILADLWRRPNTTPVLNANPSFAGNTTGYALGGVGGSLTYSTTQSAPLSSPGSARLVPSGSYATPNVESTTVVVDGVSVLYASGWIRPDTANKPIFLQINWYTSAGTYITSVPVTITAPVAAAWQYIEVYADPSSVGGVGRATIAAGLSGTPATTDAAYVDELRLRVFDPTTPVRIAAAVTPPATVNDWGPASGVDYEYRWTAKGSTGTTVVGPWLA